MANPKIYIYDAPVVTEGGQLAFHVELKGDWKQHGDIYVDYRTKDGTAKHGSDYEREMGTLKFTKHDKHEYIYIDTYKNGDHYKGTEYMYVHLDKAKHGYKGYSIDDKEGRGDIRDYVEPKPKVWAEDWKAEEGNPGDKTYLKFKVHVEGDHKHGMEVKYYTRHDTANEGGHSTDYVPKGGSLYFGKNEYVKEVKIEIKPDTKVEKDEHMYFRLEHSKDYDLKGNKNYADGWILNDDGGHSTPTATFTATKVTNTASDPLDETPTATVEETPAETNTMAAAELSPIA